MDWDNITRTGARAPGVERRQSLAWRCCTEQIAPTQCGGQLLPRRTRRAEANLIDATGMLGASLTDARSGKTLSDRPAYMSTRLSSPPTPLSSFLSFFLVPLSFV